MEPLHRLVVRLIHLSSWYHGVLTLILRSLGNSLIDTLRQLGFYTPPCFHELYLLLEFCVDRSCRPRLLIRHALIFLVDRLAPFAVLLLGFQHLKRNVRVVDGFHFNFGWLCHRHRVCCIAVRGICLGLVVMGLSLAAWNVRHFWVVFY